MSLMVGGFGVSYEGKCASAGCYYPANMTHFVDFGGEEARSWSGTDLPQPRFGHCVTQINETTLMVMGGGHSFDTLVGLYMWNYTYVKSTLFYDIQKESWSQGPDMNLAKGKMSTSRAKMFCNFACGATTTATKNDAVHSTHVLSVAWSENFENLTAELWSSTTGDWNLLPDIPCQIQTDVSGDPYQSFIDVFSFTGQATQFDIYVLASHCQKRGLSVFGLDLSARQWSAVVTAEETKPPDFFYGTVIPMTTRPNEITNALALYQPSNPVSHPTKFENGKCKNMNVLLLYQKICFQTTTSF